MASEGRGTISGLIRDLFRAPYRFNFYQAVRLLEYRHRELAGRDLGPGPRHPMVGGDRPDREIARFRVHPGLSFPAGAISRLEGTGDGEGGSGGTAAAEMVVTFFGLTGPSGVLPRHYTELLIGRLRDKDTALRDFLDTFHHRLISLQFQAWAKYRLPIGYERSQLDDPDRKPDMMTLALYCLVGLGTPGLRGRLEVDDHAFLHFSGHFAHFPRSAVALEQMLADYLGLPARILSLQGQWLQLEPEDQTRMPDRRHPRGRNNQLGTSLIVGERVWDVQSKIRVRVGPLTWRQFLTLMPDGRVLRPLWQLTRSYVGPELDFDVQPIVGPDEVPPSRLAVDPEAGLYLGWNSWICSLTMDHEADDAVFSAAREF